MGVKSGLLTLFLGAIGEMYTRVNDLNGSLDKPWLLLFFVFPLSIVSSIWHFMGWVEKGEGSDPMDAFVYILPVASMMFCYIFWNLCDVSDMVSTPLILFFGIITFAAARIFRKANDCKEYKEEITFGTAIGRGIDSAIISTIVAPIIGYLSYLPFIGILFTPWSMLGYVPGLDVGILAGLIHLFMNMEANTWKSEKEEMCKKTVPIFSWINLIRILVGMVLAMGVGAIPI